MKGDSKLDRRLVLQSRHVMPFLRKVTSSSRTQPTASKITTWFSCYKCQLSFETWHRSRGLLPRRSIFPHPSKLSTSHLTQASSYFSIPRLSKTLGYAGTPVTLSRHAPHWQGIVSIATNVTASSRTSKGSSSLSDL